MFNLSPIYSARKSSNHKLYSNHKNSNVIKIYNDIIIIIINQNLQIK